MGSMELQWKDLTIFRMRSLTSAYSTTPPRLACRCCGGGGCAVDCGRYVNTGIIEAQVQGAVLFRLTAAFYDELTFEQGRIQQSNFHDYPMLRINDTPEIEVHIVKNNEKSGGIGEPGVPCAAPAVANAIFAATGKRIRKLPIRMSEAV